MQQILPHITTLYHSDNKRYAHEVVLDCCLNNIGSFAYLHNLFLVTVISAQPSACMDGNLNRGAISFAHSDLTCAVS